jgi:hypothetical protein
MRVQPKIELSAMTRPGQEAGGLDAVSGQRGRNKGRAFLS